MNTKKITAIALGSIKKLGAEYGDIRIVRREQESIIVKNGKVEGINSSSSIGFGIRVLYNGYWGFASSNLMNTEEVEKIAKLAVNIAKASGTIRKEPLVLEPLKPLKDTWTSPYKIDPFSVSIEEKLDMLIGACIEMQKVPGIIIANATCSSFKEIKTFSSSEGRFITQTSVQAGAGIEAFSFNNGEVQKRSYPGAFGGDFANAGWEFVKEMKLCDNARRIAEEAVALLSAPQCPAGELDIILEGSQLALQVHESCGHPIELDRVFGTERSLAGTSFLTTEKLNKLKYGSKLVNITADATLKHALGSFGYDDEGIPAQKSYIVKNGVFVGYLTSRETAAKIGQKSNGTMRADGHNRLPLIRMTSINLLPGKDSFENLVAGIKNGIYMETNKSWSIDDKRLNFQFACEIGWLIKNGKIKHMIKNPNYTGITPEFWGNCDGITGKKEWKIWGVPNCGKGDPMQTARVSHGVSRARFRKVKVGVGKW
ncbi:MAG TPA: TldD/PmbA family protein [Firmicutes bacterium]|nr:TldD/PmbA family protein [Bacillota bacterium]